MTKNIQPHMQKNRGFTLVEALIAFFILSIGMLGIASLQTLSLKAGKTSVYTSVATMKVDEILESMRANHFIAPTVLKVYEGGGSPIDCSTFCNEFQFAAYDVYWWKENVKAGLPGDAVTSIIVDSAAAPSKMATVTVSISWNERKQDAVGVDAKTYQAISYICHTEPC